VAGHFPILTDENTAKGIASALIERGWDVVRSVRTLEEGTPDDVLLQKAADLDRVLLSRDVDLEIIAHRWMREWRRFPGLLFWRQQPRQERATIGQVVDTIEELAKQDDPFAYPIVYLNPRR
jgi:hypothetical protein